MLIQALKILTSNFIFAPGGNVDYWYELHLH